MEVCDVPALVSEYLDRVGLGSDRRCQGASALPDHHFPTGE